MIEDETIDCAIDLVLPDYILELIAQDLAGLNYFNTQEENTCS